MLPQSADVNTPSSKTYNFSTRRIKRELVKSLKKELIGKIPPTANNLYCFLEYYCGHNFSKSSNFHVLTSVKYLAERFGVSTRTIHYALEKLKELKLIIENDTEEFIAVKSEVTGKSLKLGRSFSVLPLGDQEIFQKQQSEEEKNLSIEEQKMHESEINLHESEKNLHEFVQKFHKESSETVTKPSVSEGIYNKDNKYNKNNNLKEDFEKIYEIFPKRNEAEYVTSALLEKFEQAKTELGLEKLQEHVERYAKDREEAIRKDEAESKYTSRFYTWLAERKWERYKEKSVQKSEKRLNTTITEADIDALDECNKAKEIRKNILRSQGQDIYASWIKPLRITFSRNGKPIVYCANSWLCEQARRLYDHHFKDYGEPEYRILGEKYEDKEDVETKSQPTTEADIDALDECDKAKELRKNIFRKISEDRYSHCIKPLRISFLENGKLVVYTKNEFEAYTVRRLYREYFVDAEVRTYDESK